jgi:hypothetical protein
MKFFREARPSVYIATGKLATELDCRIWTSEYDELLSRERPIAIIVNAADRPPPATGKPMVLWMKARKPQLAQFVRITVYIVVDEAERAHLERNLPFRAKASPFPMAAAANETEAIAKAMASLQ